MSTEYRLIDHFDTEEIECIERDYPKERVEVCINCRWVIDYDKTIVKEFCSGDYSTPPTYEEYCPECSKPLGHDFETIEEYAIRTS